MSNSDVSSPLPSPASMNSFKELMGGPEALKYERENFKALSATLLGSQAPWAGELLVRASLNFPDKLALETSSRALTYNELFLQVADVASHYRSLGIAPGDRVLLYVENSLEFYLFYYAAWHCGATVIPVNTFLHEKELAHVINDAQPKLIATLSKNRTLLEPIINDAGIVLVDESIITEKSIFESREAALQSVPLRHQKPDDIAVMLYTSGTSGIPKGVMLSSRNIVTNAVQASARLQTIMTPHEKFFGVLPLFHAFAQCTCLWLPVIVGSSVIVISKIDRSFILEGLKKQPTVFFGFPALFGLLCLMKTAPLDSVKLFVSGADALPDRIRVAFALLYGRRIASGYGLTEASPVVAIHHANEEKPSNNIGTPLPGIECQIRSEEGAPVPVGTVGLLWVKGDNVMRGYYNAPEATSHVIVDGWLSTGDLASMDVDGSITMQGRSKDLIIHKGFNIYPQEVENVILKHPAVMRAAVVGVEDPAGQIPIAYVAFRGEQPPLFEKELRELCGEHLATYKIPRRFVCREELPLTATGKIDKKQLRG